METSLHRDLKARYAGSGAATEVRLGAYRIDAVVAGELIEIQHGSLSAIRDKVRRLLEAHRVRVVKPIVVRKLLVQCDRAGGPVVRRRKSPKCGTLLDLFDELVYFTRVFPHPRLTLEVVLVDVEEWRYPGHGRRRRYRARDFVVADQKLSAVHECRSLRTADDLRKLIACRLPTPFDTAALAAGLSTRRWIAQRIAYCLRHMGAVREVGKRGNARLYEFVASRKRRRAG